MARRGVAAVALAVASLAVGGCGGSSDDPSGDVASVGAPDGDCPMPVTFDVLDGWSADTVTAEEATALAEGAYGDSNVFPGALRLACEIESDDAVGYVRTYVGGKDLVADPKAVLTAFAAEIDDPADLSFTTSTSEAGLELTEASYTPSGVPGEVRVFLAAGAEGPVVVRIAALDDEMSEDLQPVFDLARSSVRATD